MKVFLSNWQKEPAYDLFHHLVNANVHVITFSGLNDIFKLVREDTSESKVIPILLDISPDNHQQNKCIEPGSKTPKPEDILKNLPTPCHLINFDGENFTKLIPELGKRYDVVTWKISPKEFQNGCQKLLDEMVNAGSRGKVFNIIVVNKIKFQKKALTFLRNTPRSASMRGNKTVVRPSVFVPEPLIRALKNLHELNWNEFQLECKKIECKKKCEGKIQRLVSCAAAFAGTSSKLDEEFQQKPMDPLNKDVETKIKDLEVKFYNTGLEKQMFILNEHERRRLEK